MQAFDEHSTYFSTKAHSVYGCMKKSFVFFRLGYSHWKKKVNISYKFYKKIFFLIIINNLLNFFHLFSKQKIFYS